MKKLFNIIAILGLILPSSLYARSQIHGAGSSTVYPFITTVAEEFGKNYFAKELVKKLVIFQMHLEQLKLVKKNYVLRMV
jgi:ABC-type phosphate transport system substrate-binding protein